MHYLLGFLIEVNQKQQTETSDSHSVKEQNKLHDLGNKTSLLIIWRDMLDLCTVWMESQLWTDQVCCTELWQNIHPPPPPENGHGLHPRMKDPRHAKTFVASLGPFSGNVSMGLQGENKGGLHCEKGIQTKERLQEPINRLSSFKNKYPLSYLLKSALLTRLCGR